MSFMKLFRIYFYLLLIIPVIVAGCSRGPGDDASLPDFEDDSDSITRTISSSDLEADGTLPAGSMQIEVTPKIEAEFIEMASTNYEKNIQIQTALKNAGLYFGEIDGKAGPLTRKAIEEFQKSKGFKADGKVGPITWGELYKYLNVATSGIKPAR